MYFCFPSVCIFYSLCVPVCPLVCVNVDSSVNDYFRMKMPETIPDV